ncbi:hypothetical protein P3X46_005562 [Hevea brasiliensis]|uniref:LRAT domain-containing protein n=1 Tax=Hevea brasiliensis TaxID=3981 RepID=A0ABQ9N0C9_HEVBR|nr:protein LEAD-SENSITIVE 1 [Hevea brasiliensis]KAJ9186002.1 hypothetical protein P3X46_005562 [Hevea brasiliensis]
MVNPDELQVGDHIYVWRSTYYHHGIYVGEVDGVKYVIHFVSTENVFFVGSSSTASTSRSLPTNQVYPCAVCEYGRNTNPGVVKTCLDCFLSGGELQVKQYDGNSKPAKEVVEKAYFLLEHGFDDYDLARKNCEHFATFCKTGKPRSKQVETVSTFAAIIGAFGSILGAALMLSAKQKNNK